MSVTTMCRVSRDDRIVFLKLHTHPNAQIHKYTFLQSLDVLYNVGNTRQ